MIPSHQIYIPNDIVKNMWSNATGWEFLDDDGNIANIEKFGRQCNAMAASTIFKGDRYIDLENYSELASEIGNRATLDGVFTAVFSDGKFVGIEFLGKFSKIAGSGITAAGTTATVVG